MGFIFYRGSLKSDWKFFTPHQIAKRQKIALIITSVLILGGGATTIALELNRTGSSETSTKIEHVSQPVDHMADQLYVALRQHFEGVYAELTDSTIVYVESGNITLVSSAPQFWIRHSMRDIGTQDDLRGKIRRYWTRYDTLGYSRAAVRFAFQDANPCQ